MCFSTSWPNLLPGSFHDGALLVSYPWGSHHNDTGYTYKDIEAYMTPGKAHVKMNFWPLTTG